MESNDIFENIAKRIIAIAGIPVILGILSKTEMAELYKKVLFEYSIEKLSDTEENKIVVEDLRYIFARLDRQFTSSAEKNDFYSNYVHSILSAYNFLTEKRLSWQEVDEMAPGEFPKIGGAYVTKPSISSEEAAIWIYKEYEKELTALKESTKEKPKQYGKFRWTHFRK